MTTVARPSGARPTSRPTSSFRVAIIGAGMSGLLTAHRLAQAGIDFVVLEKNADVGGTWYENRYPGCRVDNPNHNYSYSFAQRHDWPLHFSTQDVLLDYFRDCADEFGVREHIRFGTEVRSATWDDADGAWTLVVRTADGAEDTVVAQRGRERGRPAQPAELPRHPGSRPFAGAAVPLGRAGTTTSDSTVRASPSSVPARARCSSRPRSRPRAGHLFVFQRTPPWMGPTADYHDPVSDGQQWLYAHVPTYSEWNRFWMFWRMGDGVARRA